MIYDKKYYLSKGDLNRIAESAVLAQLAAIMYESRKIGYTQFQNTMLECVAHVLNGKTLNESKTRKRYYTSSELNEQIWERGRFLLKECLLNEAQPMMNTYQQQKQDKLNGQKKKSSGFWSGLARFFGFEPDDGWSWGNVLNGIITLGSLIAAPFTGGGSFALKTAATGLGRAAISGLGRSAVKGIATNVGKAALGTAGKAALGTAGRTVAKQAAPSLIRGMWTSAGRQALANQARRNFATSAGRAAIAKSAAKGIGTNLAFVHGSNLLFGQPGSQGQQMYPNGNMQYAQNPYGGYYGAY